MNGLFFLGVMLSDSQAMNFAFRSHSKAKIAYQAAQPLRVHAPGFGTEQAFMCEIVDDFGTTATLDRLCIKSVWLEDAVKVAEIAIERQLNNARTNVELNRRAQTDPKLKTAAIFGGDMARMNGGFGPGPRMS